MLPVVVAAVQAQPPQSRQRPHQPRLPQAVALHTTGSAVVRGGLEPQHVLLRTRARRRASIIRSVCEGLAYHVSRCELGENRQKLRLFVACLHRSASIKQARACRRECLVVSVYDSDVFSSNTVLHAHVDEIFFWSHRLHGRGIDVPSRDPVEAKGEDRNSAKDQASPIHAGGVRVWRGREEHLRKAESVYNRRQIVQRPLGEGTYHDEDERVKSNRHKVDVDACSAEREACPWQVAARQPLVDECADRGDV